MPLTLLSCSRGADREFCTTMNFVLYPVWGILVVELHTFHKRINKELNVIEQKVFFSWIVLAARIQIKFALQRSFWRGQLISMHNLVFAVSHKNCIVYDCLVNIYEFGMCDSILRVTFCCSVMHIYVETHLVTCATKSALSYYR